MFTLVDGYSVRETKRLAKEELREEVKEEVIKEVKEEVREKVINELNIEFAKKLLRRERPIKEIVEDTGLPRERIEGLRQQAAG